MAQAIDAGPILLMLGGALGMSVFVERALEFTKNLIDLLPTKAFGPTTYKPGEIDQEYDALVERLDVLRRRTAVNELRKKLKALDEKIEQTADAAQRGKLQIERQGTEGELSAAIMRAEQLEGEFEEGAPLDLLLVQPATDVDTAITGRKFVMQMMAFALGIGAAHTAHIGLFNSFLREIGQTIPTSLDYILTGLFIGGGSGPVHTLIRFITERKYTEPVSEVDKVEVPEAATTVTAAAQPIVVSPFIASAGGGGGVAVAAPPSTWIDIPYQPIDVQLLETIHRRSGRPNLIIYHHTAMPLNSTFEQLVDVIKHRETNGVRWITGYHCVITGDGGIHAFCRWDRYGNHAAGYNDRSLGVSLNGNFETIERNKWSNYNGAYGPATPPDIQLKNAARITALWCILYDIPLDFDNKIIPHKQVNQHKSCPGSNFPYAEYKELVRTYHDSWKASPDALESIRTFARKPRLGDVVNV